MSGIYTKIIEEATGKTGTRNNVIEELMRGETGGVLDHVPRGQFFTLARKMDSALEDPELQEIMRSDRRFKEL